MKKPSDATRIRRLLAQERLLMGQLETVAAECDRLKRVHGRECRDLALRLESALAELQCADQQLRSVRWALRIQQLWRRLFGRADVPRGTSP